MTSPMGSQESNLQMKCRQFLKTSRTRNMIVKKLMVSFPVILQKVLGVKGLSDVQNHNLSRLGQWNKGKYKGLAEDTH